MTESMASSPMMSGRGLGSRPPVGAASLCSFGKGTGENQDAFIARANPSGTRSFAAVFDGHGEQGRVVSEYARDAFCRSLIDRRPAYGETKGALEGAYHDVQRKLERDLGPTTLQSGTTAVAAYQHRDRLFVANVGDSRAVLARLSTSYGNATASGSDLSKGKSFRAVDLSSDHKPDRPDEKRRIIEAGGKVEQLAYPVMDQRGQPRWVKLGPERVLDRNGMGGLAMSRSLGDCALRPYVTSKPEVTERQLDSKDKFVVVGSDGVWDHVSSQEAVDIASRHLLDPAKAAQEITNVARKRWQAETDNCVSDDITAVVMRLDNVKNDAAESICGSRRGSVRGSLGRSGSASGLSAAQFHEKQSLGSSSRRGRSTGLGTSSAHGLPSVQGGSATGSKWFPGGGHRHGENDLSGLRTPRSSKGRGGAATDLSWRPGHHSSAGGGSLRGVYPLGGGSGPGMGGSLTMPAQRHGMPPSSGGSGRRPHSLGMLGLGGGSHSIGPPAPMLPGRLGMEHSLPPAGRPTQRSY